MIITADNVEVPSGLKYSKCSVINDTIILKPSEVGKYFGSIEKHSTYKLGTIQSGGSVNVIKIEKIGSDEWCLIREIPFGQKNPDPSDTTWKPKAYFYYTPKNYIDTSTYIDLNPVYLINGEDSPDEPVRSKYKWLKSYQTTETYKLAKFNWIDDDTNIFVYPEYDSVGPKEKLKGITTDTLFPVQALWVNHEGVRFYETTYFSDSKEVTYYVLADYVDLVSDRKSYYQVCFNGPTRAKTITGLDIAQYVRGDIFCSTYVGKDGLLYGHLPNSGNVYGVHLDDNYLSPCAHSSDVFNNEYLGKIAQGNNVNALAKCIYTGMLPIWGKKIKYSDLTWFIDTEKPADPSIGGDSALIWTDMSVLNKSHKVSGNDYKVTNKGGSNELITVNKINHNDKSYWLCFVPNRLYDWYIVENCPEITWAKINSYDPTDTLPGYVATNNDSRVNGNIESITSGGGSGATAVESEEYKITKENSKDKYVEPSYDVTLDPGDTNFDAMKDIWESSNTEVPPEYDGWVHLKNALDYELKETDGRNYTDNRHVTKINRFRLMNSEALGTKSFIFMTRPDLNLYQETVDPNDPTKYTVDQYKMNKDLLVLPTFKYIARMKNACRSIMPSLEYYDTYSIDSPWLSIIHNQATGYLPTDRTMDTVEVGETFHGNKILYAEPTFKHKIAGSVRIPFIERRDLSLYYTIKMWVEYIHMVTIGRCKPKQRHINDQELDYAASLYYITTDETMENIVYWEKLTGVFPMSVPDSFFEWNLNSPSLKKEYEIEFAYSFRTVQDEMHLAEINNLYEKSTKSRPNGALSRYEDYNYSYDRAYNDILTKIAASYGYTDTDEKKLAQYAADSGFMKKYYYSNKPYGYNNEDGYDIYVNDSSGGISQLKANFLPNYIPSLGVHGVPYVKGPFITREPDRYKNDTDAFGEPMDNGIYKLRWV
jgi:hypothetical protein